MARRKGSVTGVDINSKSICLAQCFPDDQLVANVSIQPLDALGIDYWDTVKEGFKDLGNQVKLAGESAVTSLPGDYAIIRTISLDEDEPEVEDALEWEFSQQIIGALDEYVFDYQRIAHQTVPGASSYLVVGYRNEAVDRVARSLRTIRLVPMVVDLDIFALINTYELNYDDVASGSAVIVFGDEEKTRFILTQQGDFVDLEITEHSADTFSAESYPGIVNEALAKMRQCNPDTFGQGTVQIVYTGQLFADDEFAQQVQQGVPGAQLLYPFRKVTCSAGMNEEDLRKYSPQLAVAVGLAFRGVD